jgi:hypothetical protein
MKANQRIIELISKTKSFTVKISLGDTLAEEQIDLIRFDGKNGYMHGEFDCDNPVNKVNRQYVGKEAWRICFKKADKARIRIFTDDVDGVFSVCEQDLDTKKIRYRKFIRSVPVLAQHDYSSF